MYEIISPSYTKLKNTFSWKMKHGQGYTANNHLSDILVVLSPTVDPMGFCNISGQFERYSRCLGRVLECPDHDVDVKGRKSDLKIRDYGTRIVSVRNIAHPFV